MPQDITDTLASADIIIIPDNDKVGKEFASKIANLLTKSNSIKILDLTKKWEDLKEKGDITDVFEMIGNDAEVLTKLKELEEETFFYEPVKLGKAKVKKDKEVVQKEYKEMILLDGKEFEINLNVPRGYKIEEGKIWIKRKVGDDFVWLTFSPNIILIKSILENIGTGEEKIELIFFKPNKKEWKSIKVDKNILNNKMSILSLGNKGIPVNSSNATQWVCFLAELEQKNYENIPTIETIDRLGWVNDTTFIPYVNEKIMLDVEDNSSSWLEGYKKSGTIEQWLETMTPLRDNNIFRFILATGFVPPLLKYIGSRTFIVNLWNSSKTGKTACLYASLSAWGNPEELKTSFFSTLTGFEKLASLFSDVVIGINEKQVAQNKQIFETFIYMLNEGKSKLRGKKDGRTR